ncbi:hypothetical protein K1T71_013347 [Dendrolimus kikuchii]|uniref:Uncharacterized protein n=1 Tax=Dendrolimus kikuchii TaxID=765133 RepID=A0ACC1CHZ2_9NEOP|nr:hypothetical protein K1T71_013347 [Dendrolimus kikuchii]
MMDDTPPETSQDLSTFASDYSKYKKRRNKPPEYEDYALQIYKQPEDIINMKFDNAMKFVIPSVKKLDLAPLVTVNKIRKFAGATHIVESTDERNERIACGLTGGGGPGGNAGSPAWGAARIAGRPPDVSAADLA